MKTLLTIAISMILGVEITHVVSTPALPRIVRHKLFGNIRTYSDVDSYISQCVRDGYIIKSVSLVNRDDCEVVAEKY